MVYVFRKCIAALKALCCRTSVEGGAYTHFVVAQIPGVSNEVYVSPTLKGSSAIQHFEYGNEIEIYNGTIFHFCTGMSHIYYG